MKYLVLFTLVVASFTARAEEAIEIASFKSQEEMVDGWYHRHEYETWATMGAERSVVDGILQRVEDAGGKRSDPLLVDTVIDYGPGNWIFEWSQAGEFSMSAAKAFEADGSSDAAFKSYEQAIAYFTVASWPHLGLKNDKAALARARDAYLSAGSYLERPVEHVEFSVGKTSSKGYLHLPAGEGPFPLLIFTHGSDVTKEDALGFFTDELSARKIGLLTVDLPGIGEASHIPIQDGSDLVLAGAMGYAKGLGSIAQDQIYVAGASFGGNAAARFFFNHDAAGVVSMCGPLHRPFVAPPEVYDALPALTIDGVKSRLGILGQSNTELAEVIPALSLKVQGYAESDSKISTPLFIFTNNRDPVAPLEDLDLLESRAENVDKIVLDMVGHCPPRWMRQPVVVRWIMDQMQQH